ncbi:MAG: AEC family transporter [Rhodospirillales bacterium]|nr:AEC family transporter [Rhodospirillales bacterium]
MASLNIILPFFALVGLGYFAARVRVLKEGAVAGLNGFVFYFTLPALLYQTIAAKPVDELINIPYILGYSLAGLVLFFCAALFARLFFKTPLGVNGLIGQGSVVGNVGFLGIPLITALLGAEAAIPIGAAFMVDLLLMVPLSIVILELSGSKSTSALNIFKDVTRAAILNPFVLSMGLGLVGSVAQFDLPDIADNLLNLLAGATAPTALFAIGASLYGRPIAEKFNETIFLTFAKLILHPLLVWFFLTSIFTVDRDWAIAATLTAAMPVAGNLFIIAQRFDTYVTRSSTAILVSTTVAAIIFPILLAVTGFG